MRGQLTSTTRYALGFAFGLIAFIGAPEGARWLNGGAIAQQSLLPGNTVYGTVLNGQNNFSATGSPGQTGPVVGGQSNVTACPGQGSNVVGTYVPPGSSLSVTASGGGGSGPVIGFSSSVTVGGPNCR
jgi:hypothetical protein